jgi:phage-related protein
MNKQFSKPIRFMGSTLQSIKKFRPPAKTLAGRELRLVQQGGMPEDWRPLTSVGPGVIEIRIHRPHEHGVIYVAKFSEAIYVLNAFEKKTQYTPHLELVKARNAYAQIRQERKK